MPDSVRPHRRQPTRLPRPWDFPGKNTGVGCRFLHQDAPKSASPIVHNAGFKDLGLTALLNKQKNLDLKKRILKRGIFILSIFFPCSRPQKPKNQKTNKESSGKIRPMSGSWWLEERTLLLESPLQPSSSTLQGPESPSSVFLLLICKALPGVPLYSYVKPHRGKPFYLKLVTLSFSFLN